MNDFLRQLRSGGGKRYDKNRRSYDGPSQYRGTDRHNSRDRKGNTAHRKNYDHGQLQAIKKILETIAEKQTTLAELSNRQVLAMERIASAIEAVSDPGGFKVADEPALPSSAAPEVTSLIEKETTPEPRTEPTIEVEATPPAMTHPQDNTIDPDTSETGREAVLKMISNRRSQGDAFDKIAEYLENENVPTLSGKGKWRAQSVSRLFNQRVQQDR